MSDAAWITIDRATAFPKWELVEWHAYAPEDDCNNGGVNVYVVGYAADGTYQTGKGVVWSTPDEDTVKETRPADDRPGYCYDANGQEIKYGIDFQMTADGSFDHTKGQVGPYAVRMAGNSDVMQGIGLPLRRHWQYTAKFVYVTEGDPDPDEPPVEPTAGAWYIAKQTPRRILLKWQDET